MPINASVLQKFPTKHIKFAMYGDYINRYKRSIKFRKEPILDVLLAVDNLK